MGTYTCGHGGEEPRNMGRGAARTKRLAEYFGRPCLRCALAREAEAVRKLTTVSGVPLWEADPIAASERLDRGERRVWASY